MENLRRNLIEIEFHQLELKLAECRLVEEAVTSGNVDGNIGAAGTGAGKS